MTAQRKATERGRSTISVVDALRERILAGPPDVFLGSEAVLLAEYDVSRPTFRQVARVLEQEEMLIVRRGVGGGYYTRHPSLEMVGTVSGNYLRAHRLTIADIFETLGPIADLVQRKAARSDNEELRGRLAEHRRRFITLLAHDFDMDAYSALDGENSRLIGELAGNPLISLQMSVLNQLAKDKMVRTGAPPPRETLESFGRLRIRLIDAILAREEEVAVAVGRLLISSFRRAELLHESDEL